MGTKAIIEMDKVQLSTDIKNKSVFWEAEYKKRVKLGSSKTVRL
jgi:hypothetical protein